MPQPDPIPAAESTIHWLEHDVPALAPEIEGGALIAAGRVRAVCERLREAEDINRRAAEDWSDDDTAIRELARRVLPAAEVDGDAEGVPSRVDLVERVVELAGRKGGV